MYETVPDSRSLVAFVGDTHGDTAAIEAAAASASALGADWLVSVGDLCWQPRTHTHAELAAAVDAACARWQVRMMLVDGNNDDAEALRAGRPHDVPVRVSDLLWYAPRGCGWMWHGRLLVGLGGAVTFRRDGRTPGVDLFAGEGTAALDVRRAAGHGRADVLVSHDAPWPAPVPVELLPGAGEENRRLVGEAVRALRPRLAVHGHYHREYEHLMPSGTHVVGMGRDRSGTADLCLVDLERLRVVSHRRVGSL